MKVSIRKNVEITTIEAVNAEVISDYLVVYGEPNQYEEYMEIALKFNGQFYWDDMLWVDIPIQYIVCIDNRNEDRE